MTKTMITALLVSMLAAPVMAQTSAQQKQHAIRTQRAEDYSAKRAANHSATEARWAAGKQEIAAKQRANRSAHNAGMQARHAQLETDIQARRSQRAAAYHAKQQENREVRAEDRHDHK